MTKITTEIACVTPVQADLINRVCEHVIREAGYDPDDSACDDVAIDVMSIASDLNSEISITYAARYHMDLPILM